MKREEKSNYIKEKILDVTSKLIIKQGYKKTTTRQIIKEAGVNYGTLYHFFRDKEEILLHISMKIYSDTIDAAGTLAEKEKDPVMRYVLTRALEMKAVERYDRIAELYLEAYSSWRITQAMLPMNIEMYITYFHKYCENFTDQDYYNRALAARAIRFIFISDRVYSGAGKFESYFPFIIETTLSLFKVPDNKIKKTINKALRIIKEDSITIQDFRL